MMVGLVGKANANLEEWSWWSATVWPFNHSLADPLVVVFSCFAQTVERVDVCLCIGH